MMVKDKAKKTTDEEGAKVEPSLLQGRLSFFLTATAFLIAAFAVVVTFLKGSGSEVSAALYLAHAINATGLYAALFFAMDNFHGAMTIKTKDSSSASELAIGLTKCILGIIYRPLPINGNGRPKYIPGYVDTWLVPSFFVVFWIVVWFIVIPDNLSDMCEIWVPLTFGIGLPLGYLLLISWLHAVVGLFRK